MYLRARVCLKNTGEVENNRFGVLDKGAFEGQSGYIPRKRPVGQIPKDVFSGRHVFFRHTLAFQYMLVVPNPFIGRHPGGKFLNQQYRYLILLPETDATLTHIQLASGVFRIF